VAEELVGWEEEKALDQPLTKVFTIVDTHTRNAQMNTTVCGEDAIKEYADALKSGHPFNLVILDLTVPGAMGGQDAAAHILKTDPTAQLIVSSGYADDPVLANHIQKLHF